jgi:hypothetical protein
MPAHASPTSPIEWLGILPPAPTGVMNSTISPGPSWDAQSSLPVLGKPSFREQDMWPLVNGDYSPLPVTTTSTAALVVAVIDTNGMGPGDALSPPVDQQTDSDQHHQNSGEDGQKQSPLAHTQIGIQRLCSLQLVLYEQLKHLQTFKETTGASGKAAGLQGPDLMGTFSIDNVLNSCQAFIAIVNSLRMDSSDNTEVRPVWTTFSDNTPLGEMDTSMGYIVMSCFARLLDIYDEMFNCFGCFLQSTSWRQLELQSSLPCFQLGQFQLRDCGRLQVSILVQLFMHALGCVEVTMSMAVHLSVTRLRINSNGKHDRYQPSACCTIQSLRKRRDVMRILAFTD